MPLTDDQERAFILNGEEPEAPAVLPYTGAPSTVLPKPALSSEEEKDVISGNAEAPSANAAFAPLQGAVQYLADRTGKGYDGVMDNFDGYKMMKDPSLYKEIPATPEQVARDSRIENFQNSMGLLRHVDILGATAEQLPQLEKTLEAAAISGLAGGAVGGTAGLLGGPAAGVTVPGGAVLGAIVGARTGGAAASYQQGIGEAYLNLRRKGKDHETAKKIALGVGLFNGSLELFGTAYLGQVIAKTFAKEAAKKGAENVVKTTLVHKILDFGKDVGVEVSEELAQEMASILGERIAGLHDRSTPDKERKDNQATWDRLFNVGKEALLSSVGLVGGAKGIGKVAGNAASMLENATSTREAFMAAAEARKEVEEEEQEKLQGPFAVTTQVTGQVISKSKQEKERQAAERAEKRRAREQEINRIFDAAYSLFTIDTPETRLKEVSRIQQVLKRMISNSDTLDDKTKVKLLKRIINDVHTTADLLRTGSAFIEEQRGQEYRNEVEKGETRIQEAIESGQPKEGKAKLPEAAQKSLQWYNEFFTAPKVEKADTKFAPGEKKAAVKAAALQRATDFIEKGFDEEVKTLGEQVNRLERGELAEIYNQSAELAEKRRIATEAHRYWSDSLSPEELNALGENIEQTVNSGKSEFLERKQAEGARLLAQRARVVEGVNGNKPVVPSLSEKPAKQMTGFGKVLNSLRRTSTALWDKLLQDTPIGERQKIVNEILDFTQSENREAAINMQATEKFDSLVSKAVGGIREFNRLVKDGMKSELFNQEYVDANGETQKLGRLSINQLVYLHMAFQDRGVIPGLVHGNKFTMDGMLEDGVSTQESVRDILANKEGGKYLKLAEAIQRFYQWFGPTVANHYLKEYGLGFDVEKTYSGRIYHRKVELLQSAPDILEAAHSYVKRNVSATSTKARTNSKLPVHLVDPFQEVQRHRSQMAFWIANSEKARELSFIFSDSSKDGLRDLIEHKLSEDFMNLIDSRIAWQYHLKPGVQDGLEQAAQRLKSDMATGWLGLRFDQTAKQMTTILSALSTNSYRDFIGGLRAASDRKQLDAYISRSELYKDRRDQLLPQILEATNERSYLDAITGDRTFTIKQLSLIPMSKWGDGVASAVTGFIEFNRVFKETGDIDAAVLAGDRLIDKTASSSRKSQRVPAEFKGGLSSLMLTFAKQNIQYLNLESGVIRDAILHPDKEHAARAFRTILAIHAAQTLFQYINNLPAYLTGDDDDKEEANRRLLSAALTGAFSSLPLISFDIGLAGISALSGETISPPKTILGNLASNVFTLGTRWLSIAKKNAEGEEITGEQWTNAFRSLASVASIGTGLPFFGAFQSASFLNDLMQGPSEEELAKREEKRLKKELEKESE